MILSCGMLKKYVVRLSLKKVILLPNFAVEKSMCLISMCLFFKLVSSLFLQIFPPNLKLTFLLWCSGWRICTFVEAACPQQNWQLFLNSHHLLLLIGEQEHDHLECRVAQVVVCWSTGSPKKMWTNQWMRFWNKRGEVQAKCEREWELLCVDYCG